MGGFGAAQRKRRKKPAQSYRKARMEVVEVFCGGGGRKASLHGFE